jgi:K(+)-stimulated pyrophosphate-energized sodium pump
MDKLIYLVPAMGLLGLIYTFIKFNWVAKQEAGTDRMKEISTYIAEGAMAFLKAEWRILTYFAIIVALLLGFMGSRSETSHWSIAIAFLIGAFFSALAGFIGMKAATKANVRTAHAARTSFSKALSVSFGGGSVMGMGVAGLAVLGLGGLFIVLLKIFAPGVVSTSLDVAKAIEILTGFSLGLNQLLFLPGLAAVFTQKPLM